MSNNTTEPFPNIAALRRAMQELTATATEVRHHLQSDDIDDQLSRSMATMSRILKGNSKASGGESGSLESTRAETRQSQETNEADATKASGATSQTTDAIANEAGSSVRSLAHYTRIAQELVTRYNDLPLNHPLKLTLTCHTIQTWPTVATVQLASELALELFKENSDWLVGKAVRLLNPDLLSQTKRSLEQLCAQTVPAMEHVTELVRVEEKLGPAQAGVLTGDVSVEELSRLTFELHSIETLIGASDIVECLTETYRSLGEVLEVLNSETTADGK